MAEGIMKKFYGTDTYVQSVGVKNDLEIDGFSIAVCKDSYVPQHMALAGVAMMRRATSPL